jgi:hypothetical protein
VEEKMTKRPNEQVKQNPEGVPPDFIFQLTREEYDALRSQFATSKTGRGRALMSPPTRETKRIGFIA